LVPSFMYPTRKQIFRLIRNADRVSVNDIFYSVMSHNLQKGYTGPAISLVDQSGELKRFSLEDLLKCKISTDGYTLMGTHHLVFYKLKILNVNGTS